ncbi:Cysteine-rich secretory protein family protein [Aquimarina sp. MAR_2010_214]|uniref:CAP domain-containing protein n=1 Tax=Aquimarina sp. MAR_2010_214 TaxID=1250026 RepID=UPI000C712F6E|nr:CAP domain-containing protein [Aquimarina sp. MAR_2010_214]PKV52120.1 Cysteine-rich secretory protein family protein [Aquimarina sp. MAR_2010_214]
MKSPVKVIYIACMAMLLYSCSAENVEEDLGSSNKEFIVPEVKSIEIEILDLINNYRISKELNALTPLDVIKSQAYRHTDYMIKQNNISHDYFYERKSYLVTNAGASKVAENVGYGYSSAESIVNAWIKSDSHRSTIEGDFTAFDISIEQNEDGVMYCTNIFIKK